MDANPAHESRWFQLDQAARLLSPCICGVASGLRANQLKFELDIIRATCSRRDSIRAEAPVSFAISATSARIYVADAFHSREAAGVPGASTECWDAHQLLVGDIVVAVCESLDGGISSDPPEDFFQDWRHLRGSCLPVVRALFSGAPEETVLCAVERGGITGQVRVPLHERSEEIQAWRSELPALGRIDEARFDVMQQVSISVVSAYGRAGSRRTAPPNKEWFELDLADLTESVLKHHTASARLREMLTLDLEALGLDSIEKRNNRWGIRLPLPQVGAPSASDRVRADEVTETADGDVGDKCGTIDKRLSADQIRCLQDVCCLPDLSPSSHEDGYILRYSLMRLVFMCTVAYT
jgi:hypothetical protein